MFSEVFIDSSDPSYAERVSSIAHSLSRKELLPFLGAGISHPLPSGLPLADGLKSPLVSAMECALRRFLGPEDRAIVEAALQRQPLERLLDALYTVFGEPTMEYLHVLDSTACNSNHLAIAALVAEGWLPDIVTLNFDVLIERALDLRELPYEVVCPLANTILRRSSREPSTVIVKPHGSIALPGDCANRLRHVSATLSQVGDRPASENMAALRALFLKRPTLFVAGYSDNDWDIFPIIENNHDEISSVFWVEYVSPKLVAARVKPEIPQKLRSFLSKKALCTTLLYGNVATLLQDCLASCDIGAPTPVRGGHQTLHPDCTWCHENPGLTSLAVAIILGMSEARLNKRLLERLGQEQSIKNSPRLLALRHRILANIWHTERDVERALRLNKEALTLCKAHNAFDDESLASSLIWLGYEHLCLAKRPNPLHPVSILMLPFNVLRGLSLLNRGYRLATLTANHRQQGLAKYYKVDLLHCWSNLLLLLGHRPLRLFRWVFRAIERRYSRILSDFPLLMDWSYYWFRHLEVTLLAGLPIDASKCERKILDIGYGHERTQNDVQMGNAAAYLALLKFHAGAARGDVDTLLTEAENVWTSPAGRTVSGLFRVTLFRRYVGITGLQDACRQLFRLL